MAGYNKVILMGNLTKDPETAIIGEDTHVTNMRMAVNRVFMKNNQKAEEVLYIDMKAFGKMAETLAKYCKKGTPLHVEGRLKLDEWQDKTTGDKRSKIYVRLENFRFLSNGNNNTKQNIKTQDDNAGVEVEESRLTF